MNGKGILYYNNNNKLKGIFKDDLINGYCIYNYNNNITLKVNY